MRIKKKKQSVSKLHFQKEQQKLTQPISYLQGAARITSQDDYILIPASIISFQN